MKTEISPVRVLAKAVCLFVLINIVYALVDPQVSQASAYTTIFPGRTRLPFGVVGDPYTVTVDDLDTMFASHAITVPKQPAEYRIVLIGDSSVWGEGLGAYDVISEQWNRLNMECGEKTVKAYNLGYPHPSVVKDLVILNKAMEYEPDLIVWFVTLNTLISQRLNPFLTANRERTLNVLTSHAIAFKQREKLTADRPGFYEKTLVGQRSNLARQAKLQMLGVVWTATGADSNTMAEDEPPSYEVGEDPRYRGLDPGEDIGHMLLFSALKAGHNVAGDIPVLIVNEPIFIARKNMTSVRYNAGYPRWAYDQYREAIRVQAEAPQWNYLDLWDAIPGEYFSDAGLHLSAGGERLLIEEINPTLIALGCDQPP